MGIQDKIENTADKVTGKAVLIMWPIGRWGGLDAGEDAFADVPDPVFSGKMVGDGFGRGHPRLWRNGAAAMSPNWRRG